MSSNRAIRPRSASPSIERTSAAVTLPSPCAIAWSRIDSPSRALPSAARAITCSASSSTSTPSALRDVREMRGELARRDAPQVEPLAARQHRHRDLVDLGRGEQEFDVRGRLLERLQQRVEGVLRQHVDFVDDVDLVARRDRGIAHRLDDLAHVVDPGVARGVHLDDVDMAPLGDRDARLAHPARVDRRPALPVGADAVERLGDQPRGRGLADPAHPGQQEGMRDPPAGDGIAQRGDHRVLPDQLAERLRPILAREHAIGGRGGGGRLGHFGQVEAEPGRFVVDHPPGLSGAGRAVSRQARLAFTRRARRITGVRNRREPCCSISRACRSAGGPGHAARANGNREDRL